MCSNHQSQSDLDLARRLATLASDIALANSSSQGIPISQKPDFAQIEVVGNRIQDAVSSELHRHRPNEICALPGAAVTARRTWVTELTDPKAYLRGVPNWAILVGLYEDGRTKLAMATAPAMRREWWAVSGQGAQRCLRLSTSGLQERVDDLHVSAVSSIPDAYISYCGDSPWLGRRTAQKLDALVESAGGCLAQGDCVSFLQVAEGSVDVAVHPALPIKSWQLLELLVVEAGGAFSVKPTDDGSPPEVLATNRLLHDPSLLLLANN